MNTDSSVCGQQRIVGRYLGDGVLVCEDVVEEV